jgi:hypothetical protein
MLAQVAEVLVPLVMVLPTLLDCLWWLSVQITVAMVVSQLILLAVAVAVQHK